MRVIKKLFSEKKWFTLAIIVLVLLPTLPFLLATAFITLYAFWPTNLDGFEQVEDALKTHNRLTLITHGVADSASVWAQPMADKINQMQNSKYSFAIDWQYQARNVFSCAINGERIGKHLASFVTSNTLEQVHLIAHSCGAHLIYGFCKAVKSKQPKIFIKTTYLDPASVRAFNWDFGIENFGNCADVSEAYIDTDDTIPGSNIALPHSITFDVTQTRIDRQLNMNPHLWPTTFYLELIEKNTFPDIDKHNKNQLIEINNVIWQQQ